MPDGDRPEGRGPQPDVSEADELWARCVNQIRTLPPSTWKTWLGAVRPWGLRDGQLVLAVPSTFVRQRIEERCLALIVGIVHTLDGGISDVVIEVHPEAAGPVVADGQDDDRAVAPVPAPATATQAPASPAPASTSAPAEESRLNPRYTFETFVIGPSNRFAHAAALSVAETPARSHNPLFIYGDAGLGKTHLLQAIAHYVREHYQTLTVRYVPTETLLNQFIDCIRANTMDRFKQRYRGCDVLLVDDIHFMQKKGHFQEEFFHTFNALHEADRQIVVTADRAPARLDIDDRVRSRLSWGLPIDVRPPDLETRVAILQTKVQREGLVVPDDVLVYIAERVSDNIRQLEGALNRVSAYASLTREPLDLPLVHQVLSDLLTESRARQVTPQRVMEVTAEAYGFKVADLASKSRSRPLVHARQVAMYVCRELTDFSYPAIGREFGNRDHTTVMHAVDKIRRLMKERRAIYDEVTGITLRLKTGG